MEEKTRFDDHYRQILLRKLTEEERTMVRELSRSRGRHKAEIESKKYAIALLRDVYKMTFPDMGLLLNRTHSSVMRLYYKAKKQKIQFS